VAGLLRPMLADINIVAAPSVARERGIVIEETTREKSGDHDALITLEVETEKLTRAVAGTIIAGTKPRIVQIKGIYVEADLLPRMLYITNHDRPGFIGRIGTLLGENGINIAHMQFGRDFEGGNAIALVGIDQAVSEPLLKEINTIPNVVQVKALTF
jgi:D-3-phosphoglycerate dehydrogenase / 2-oxoglutarate reductase